MTLTQLVNEVLKQLREDEVTSFSDSGYSKLIARFVNLAKRKVENAWNWISLRSSVSVVAADSSDKTVTGTNNYSRILRVYNATKYCWVKPVSWETAVQYNNQATIETGDIIGYRVKSRTSEAFVVEFFPKPADSQTIVFEVVTPTVHLTDDLTSITVPDDIVINAAYTMALAERGDDGGLNIQQADKLYTDSLADAVSIEESVLADEVDWKVV